MPRRMSVWPLASRSGRQFPRRGRYRGSEEEAARHGAVEARQVDCGGEGRVAHRDGDIAPTMTAFNRFVGVSSQPHTTHYGRCAR
jgi:hypothetical protein